MNQLNIFIVEDERIIALDLQRHLERLGYHVSGISSSAEDALQWFAEATETFPDVILMDIMLGRGMNGIECACILKEKYNLPVVFLTAYADTQTLTAAKKAEPFGYILKPFRDRELQTTLEMASYKHKSLVAEVQKHGLVESILDNAQEGILLIDQSGLVEYLNQTLLEMIDLPGTPDKYVRKNLSDILKLYYPKTLLQLDVYKIIATPAEDLPMFIPELVCFDKNKHTRTISLQVGTIRQQKKLGGIVITVMDLTRIKDLVRSVEYQQLHDSLTALPNRVSFINSLNTILSQKRSQDNTQSLTPPQKVVLINIDKFRILNEIFGHIAGDQVLRKIATDIELIGMQYQSDAARIGADEFALVCSGSNEEFEQHFLTDLAHTFSWDGQEFFITVSIGVVDLSPQMLDANSILAAADDACSRVKQRGGNGIEYYHQSLSKMNKVRGEALWVTRVVKGLKEGSFRLFGQEISPLRANMQAKREILLRLLDEQGRIVGPGTFIGAAERYNIMPSIDLWVLTATLEYLTKQSSQDNKIYCVNLSGNSLQDTSTIGEILKLLSSYASLCSKLCLEITETSAIQNFDRVIGFINEARGMGIIFALDDFGNGFSSFSYLKKLPVSILKIDGSFVKDIDKDPKNLAMVTAINNIGHELGMRTVAEFVSSAEILHHLQIIGVDYAQGFHISEPAPLP